MIEPQRKGPGSLRFRGLLPRPCRGSPDADSTIRGPSRNSSVTFRTCDLLRNPLFLDLAQPSIDVSLGPACRAHRVPLVPPLHNRAHGLTGRRFRLPRAAARDNPESFAITVNVPLEPGHAPNELLAPIPAGDRLIRAGAARSSVEPRCATFVVVWRIRRFFFCHTCIATISKGNSGDCFGFGWHRIPADRALSLTPHVHSTRVLAPSFSLPQSAHRYTRWPSWSHLRLKIRPKHAEHTCFSIRQTISSDTSPIHAALPSSVDWS